MSKKKIKAFGLVILMTTSAWMVACSYLEMYPQDNVVEEIAEEMLDNLVGLDVDLSPESSEKP